MTFLASHDLHAFISRGHAARIFVCLIPGSLLVGNLTGKMLNSTLQTLSDCPNFSSFSFCFVLVEAEHELHEFTILEQYWDPARIMSNSQTNGSEVFIATQG